MKKKFAAFLTATAMMLSLAACGNAENSSNDVQIEETQQQVTALETETEDAQEEEQTAEVETVTEELQQPEKEETPNETQPELSSENEQLITAAADIDDSNAEDQGICGEDLRWYFANNILVIRGTGDMSECPWAENHIDDIYSVVIEDGCTGICNEAFAASILVGDEIICLSNLNRVILPDTLVTIGEYAFFYCTNLTDIDIPDSVTEIDRYAFSCCGNLTSVTIPDSVTTIGMDAFAETGITSIDIPGSVTYLSGFRGTAISGIHIPDSVTTIGDLAFRDCKNLTGIEIPNGVTTIDSRAFFNCDNLTSITIPDSVTTIGEDAFFGCDNLTDVTIPNADVAISSDAFNSGTKVTVGGTEIEWDEEGDGWNRNNS